MKTRKEPVRLRYKKLANGNQSIYLDIYSNGRRSYEFLKLYLIPEVTPLDKQNNRQTMRVAQSVKAQRVLDINEGRYGLKSTRGDKSLYTAISEYLEYKKETAGAYAGTCKAIKAYQQKDTTLSSLDRWWVLGLKEYLDNTDLKPNTKKDYLTKTKIFLNWCIKQEYITSNPFANVSNFKGVQVDRVYLTAEELRSLASTPCKYPDLKRAFLFSCLTGLRFSDTKALRWEDVSYNDSGNCRITFYQQKTKGLQYLDINPEATLLLGDKSTGVIFDLNSRNMANRQLKQWSKKAGITKNISYHTARHTFATLSLASGVDLYVVSKLLGHSDIKTTQVYAKVIDKQKQDAMMSLPSILGENDSLK